MLWFLNIFFKLFLACFFVLVLPYEVLVFVFPIIFASLIVYGLVSLLFLFIKFNLNKKLDSLLSTLTDFLLCVFFILLTINPVDKMSEQQKNDLPCLGNVDRDLKNVVKGFPEWNYTCKSVIHVGHGYYDPIKKDTFFVTGTGKRSVKEITRIYEEQKQYVVSCRGDIYENPIKTILSFSLSFGFQQKERETINGKEVYYFAKKGNLLVLNQFSNWLSFE